MMRKCFYKEVSDDWHPNWKVTTKVGAPQGRFQADIVAVSMFALSPGFTHWRVCVWGADDFGMEFDSVHEERVQERFDAIANHDGKIDRHFLEDLGFFFA